MAIGLATGLRGILFKGLHFPLYCVPKSQPWAVLLRSSKTDKLDLPRCREVALEDKMLESHIILKLLDGLTQ